MHDPLLSGIVQILSKQGVGGGTGFVISRFGYIATCAHVIQLRESQLHQPPPAQTIAIRFQETSEEREATIVCWRPSNEGDIAILRVNGELPLGVRPLHLGSSQMTKGHEIYTYGFPAIHGIRGSHGSGKSYGVGPFDTSSKREYLQLQSQEIKPGFSGAPIWDAVRREVIGMITKLTKTDERGQKAGTFAIPIDDILELVNDLNADIPVASLSPYVGARPFYEGEAGLFFGYEELLDRLVYKLRDLQEIEQEPSFLALLGPASSGKTSVIQAGLMDRLRKDAVPGSQHWEILCVTAGEHPYEQLAAVGLEDAEDGLVQSIQKWEREHPHWKRLVLILDHFERTLLHCPKEVLDPFIAHLEACIEQNCATILLVMQNTAYSLLSHQKGLMKSIERSLVNLVPPQGRDTLAAIIQEPANALGVSLEPGLVETCVEKALSFSARAEHPNTVVLLPVYQAFLAQMATSMAARRQGHLMTTADYATTSLMLEDLNAWAESLYLSFDEPQQAMTRHMCTVLVHLGDSRQAIPDTLCTVPATALCHTPQEEEHLQRLIEQRLLTFQPDLGTGRDQVRLAQEALLSEWPRLKTWLEEERRFVSWLQTTKQQMQADAHEREKALLSEDDLQEAELWLKRRSSHLEREIQVTIEASQRYYQQEEQQRKMKEEHERQKTMALARELAIQANRKRKEPGSTLQQSVLLSMHAVQRDLTIETYQALHDSVALLPHLVTALSLRDTAQMVSFSPNDGYCFAAGRGGMAWLQSMSAGNLFCSSLWIGSEVLCAAFSHDSRWIVTAGSDGRVKRWETKTGQLVQTVESPACRLVACSPSTASLLAVASDDGLLRLWKLDENGNVSVQWKHHCGSVHALTFHPDGRFLATAGQDGTVSIFDTDHRQLIRSIRHGGPVRAVMFSPDGTVLASASDDATVKLWSWEQQAKKAPTCFDLPHPHPVQALAFHPDGIALVTASGATLHVWEVATGREDVSHQEETEGFKHEALIHAVAFSADGRWVISCSDDQTARIWQCANKQELLRITHTKAIRSVAISQSGNYIVTGSDDGTAKIWQTLRGDQLARIAHPGGTWVAAFQALDHARYALATTGEDGCIQLSSIQEGHFQFTTRLFHSKRVRAVTFSPNGNYLASGSDDTTVKVWKVTSGEQLTQMDHQGIVTAVAFSHDSSYLASASSTGEVRMLSMKTGQAVDLLPHLSSVSVIAFGASHDLLATGGQDGVIRIWNLSHLLEGPISSTRHRGQIYALAFSPDGNVLATASEDNTARLWKWQDGEHVFTSLSHDGPVWSLAFSGDGHYMATASDDCSTKVWNVTTGEMLAYLPHRQPVGSVAFNPTGDELVTSGSALQVTMWKQGAQRQLLQFPHGRPIYKVIFSSDGKYVATTSWDGTACVWIWRHEDLLAEARKRLRRNLTTEEWEEAFGTEPYQTTVHFPTWRGTIA
jgi:WD40 repeat protein